MRGHRSEEVLFAGHPCWRSMVGFHVRALVLSVFIGVVIGIATVHAKQVQVGWVTLAVAAVFVLALLRGALRRAATTYTVTDRRVVIERGLLWRDVQEAPLSGVQNVVTHQSIRQRLLRVGTVHFDTSAGAGLNFCFSGVERPRELVRMLDRALADAHDAEWAGNQPRSIRI
jgi:uncharacterized membrane protein YdbT with pleckstrin-like domain